MNEESTLIKPQSAINTIFTHKNEISSSTIFMNTELMSTFFSQHFENQDTNKESTETINLTSENRINFDSTLLEGKQESTTNHFLDTTYVSEIRDKTTNIDTNQINIPTNNTLNETTSIKKESTSIIFKTYSQSQSANVLTPSENDFSTNVITSNPDIIESTSIKVDTTNANFLDNKTLGYSTFKVDNFGPNITYEDTVKRTTSDVKTTKLSTNNYDIHGETTTQNENLESIN